MGKKKRDVTGTVVDALKAAGMLVFMVVAVYIFYQNTEYSIKRLLYGKAYVARERAIERMYRESGDAYRYMLEGLQKMEGEAYGTMYRTGPDGGSLVRVEFFIIEGTVYMDGRYPEEGIFPRSEGAGPFIISIQDRDMDGAPDGYLSANGMGGSESYEDGFYKVLRDGENYEVINILWYSGIDAVSRAMRAGVGY